MPIDQMKQLLDSMETSVKLQHQARSQRRAEEAERDRKAFQEKLMRAAASEMELDGLSSKAKGSDDAVRRDQLVGMMMAGF